MSFPLLHWDVQWGTSDYLTRYPLSILPYLRKNDDSIFPHFFFHFSSCVLFGLCLSYSHTQSISKILLTLPSKYIQNQPPPPPLSSPRLSEWFPDCSPHFYLVTLSPKFILNKVKSVKTLPSHFRVKFIVLIMS